MLYMIVKKDDYRKLSLIEKTYFAEIENNILYNDYLFLNYTGDENICQLIFFENNIHALVVPPYISKDLYEVIYPGKDMSNFYRKFLDYSFFEVLMSSFADVQPKFEEEYVLISSSIPEEYLEMIDKFNQILKFNKLLLNIENIKPSLSDIFVNSMNKIVEQEVRSEIMNTEDVEKINNDYFDLTIAEFIIESSKYYSKKQIRKYLLKEFNIFMKSLK